MIGARNDESTYRPYGAVLRLLSQVGAESEELPEDADGLLARRLVRLRQGSLPTGNEIFEGPTGAEIERRLTAEAVHRLLELEAHVRGLLVVATEDAQWADQGTLDVVREIGTAAAAAPLLMIVTYRDTPRSPGLAAALHALDREVSSHRIDLSPFTVDEIHELAGDPAPGFVDAVMRRTDGNPLLVSELLRSPGRAVDTLPSGVRDLVDSWLASCDPDAITFAEVAGLIGRTFNPYVAYTALRGKPGRTITENARLGAIVEQLRASGLVRDAERGTDLQFTHDLFREAVLARLPSSDTRNGHRRIVDVLEADNGDDLDALVHHSVGGELADKAASHLRTRSLRSLQSGLVEEAVADASAAQRWLENCDAVDPERSIELGLVIADALALAARGPEAEGELRRLLVMAEHLSGSSAIRLRSAIHRRRARIHLAERRLPEAIAAIEQSVNLIGSDVPVDATLIDEWIESFLAVSSLDYYSAHGVPWAIGWIDRLNEPVLRHGSVRQRVQYFSNMGPVLNMDTRYTGPQNIIDVVRDQLVAAAELGDASLIASAKFGNGFVHFCRLDGRIAAPFFDDAVRRYEHIADRLWVEIGHVYRAMCERLLGNLAETARRSEAALVTSATLVPPAYLAMLETNLAWCEHRSGGDARPLVRSALDRFDAPTASTYPFKGFALWLALALAHADGRRDEVRRLAEALVHPFQRALPPDVEQLVRSVASASSSARVEGDLKRVLVWARERHFV